MQINRARISQLLKDFEFELLLIDELGWDRHTQRISLTIDETEYLLTTIAEKRGMVVFHCSARTDGNIPDYAIRRKIQREVAKSVHENLIIYTDTDKTTQIWQRVVKRKQRKGPAPHEHRYHRGQSGEALIQKLRTIVFSLDEEADLTLTDVIRRVDAAFNVEGVTKRFYEHFKGEHNQFLNFLEGIPDQEMERWYASVMLNRLMFIYFIQKKNFLNNDPNYLRTKLEESQLNGDDRYYTNFLCPLFFEGFAKPEFERSREAQRLLGKVPYLNGGIFQRHQIEELHGEKIQIADAAFERLFDFFEAYQWHLDERPFKDDNEIDPEVLGYIFEKYINQKQMGAYYTQEDITEYISKNTIIPSLFATARKKSRIAFEREGSVWQLLRDDPDCYIYDAVKTGVGLGLPDEIAAGIDDVSKRELWNTLAPDEYANPTEIWREVVARQNRYEAIHTKLSNGEIYDIHALIVHNLNIHRFAQDVIKNCEDSKLLDALWKTITQMKILDPTCGSGAFLFAVLNILEPLYEACLDRMEVFLGNIEHSREKSRTERFRDFRKVLEDIDRHPNRRYFILKSIIINNLYGVDIMEEAIEICKLRLFLKMVAQIEDVRQIEPLPDIDFNVQAGNTLVGYATYEAVAKAVIGKINFGNIITRIKESAEDVDHLFEQFRLQQTELGGTVEPDDKQVLRNKLQVLEDELNRYLADEYGVDPREESAYQNWLSSHKPFHWFIEFYGILKDGGFDVIIGNPPYVALKKIGYSLPDYTTIECGDLFALCCERSASLNNRYGSLAMIIPLSGYSTEAMSSLRNLLLDSYSENHLSYFSASDQPASLFTGVRNRLMIFVNRRSSHKIVSTTRFLKWFRIERDFLFTSILKSHSISSTVDLPANSKLSNPLEESILKKILAKPTLGLWRRKHGSKDSAIYYHNAPVHWGKVFDFIPFYQVGDDEPTISSHIKCLFYKTEDLSKVVLCFLNSSLFYWWNWHFTNCRDLSITDIDRSRIDLSDFSHESIETFNRLAVSLMTDLKKNSKIYRRVSKGILTQFDSFYPALFKHIIDDIDRALAQHYDFTGKELDFIINYDIKYRMGLGSG